MPKFPLLPVCGGLLFLGLSPSACVVANIDDPPPEEEEEPELGPRALQTFGDCEQMLKFARAHALEVSLAGELGGGGRWADEDVWEDGDAAGTAGGTGADTGGIPQDGGGDKGGGGNSGSATNIQEAGVDEPDIMKVAGQHLAVLSRHELHLIDTATQTLASSLELPEIGWNRSMFVAGSRVIIFTRSASDEISATGQPHNWLRAAADREVPLTQVIEVDISNARAPIVVRSAYVQGELISARMLNEEIKLVTSSPPMISGLRNWQTFLDEEALWDLEELAEEGHDVTVMVNALTQDAKDIARDYNLKILADTDVEDWIPRLLVDDQSKGTINHKALTACDAMMRPGTPAGMDLLNVITIGTGEGVDVGHTTSVFANGDMIYASTDSLYVASWPVSNWGLGGPAIGILEGGDALDDVGIGGSATATATGATIPEGGPREGFRVSEVETVPQTHIHKFDIATPGTTVYRSSGGVDGRLLSQWAMSEYGGHLRVASTVDAWWQSGAQGQSDNLVTVLAEGEAELVETGRVAGLGLGEEIKAVRFMGPMGYVVTFRQIDPLYVLDLNNPAAPTVLGELKIPGFSSYLHPVGDGLLLGVGRDGDLEGNLGGLALSLFNVANPANPQRMFHHPLKADESPIERDHHAFRFIPERSWAIIPAINYGWNDGDSEIPDVGASEGGWDGEDSEGGEEGDWDGDDTVGEEDEWESEGGEEGWDDDWEDDYRVESAAHVFQVDGQSGIVPVAKIVHDGDYEAAFHPPHRSALIGSHLYTISDFGVKVTDVNGFVEINWIDFSWYY